MDSETLIAITLGLSVGSGIGFVLGRYAGGGWLLACNLVLALIALGLMSSDVLEAIGIPRQGFNQIGYFAFGMLVLTPALAGSIVFGGVGLWRAAQVARARGGED